MQDNVTLGLMWNDTNRLRHVERVEAHDGAVTGACSACELLLVRGVHVQQLEAQAVRVGTCLVLTGYP